MVSIVALWEDETEYIHIKSHQRKNDYLLTRKNERFHYESTKQPIFLYKCLSALLFPADWLHGTSRNIQFLPCYNPSLIIFLWHFHASPSFLCKSGLIILLYPVSMVPSHICRSHMLLASTYTQITRQMWGFVPFADNDVFCFGHWRLDVQFFSKTRLNLESCEHRKHLHCVLIHLSLDWALLFFTRGLIACMLQRKNNILSPLLYHL